MAEHTPDKREAAGSSPASRTTSQWPDWFMVRITGEDLATGRPVNNAVAREFNERIAIDPLVARYVRAPHITYRHDLTEPIHVGQIVQFWKE